MTMEQILLNNHANTVVNHMTPPLQEMATSYFVSQFKDMMEQYYKKIPQADYSQTKQLDTIVVKSELDEILQVVETVHHTNNPNLANQMSQIPFEKGRIKFKGRDTCYWLAFWTKKEDIQEIFHTKDEFFEEGYDNAVGVSIYLRSNGIPICLARFVMTYQYEYEQSNEEMEISTIVHPVFEISSLIQQSQSMNHSTKKALQEIVDEFSIHEIETAKTFYTILSIFINVKIQEATKSYQDKKQNESTSVENIGEMPVSQKKKIEESQPSISQKKNIIHIGDSISITRVKGSKITRSNILHRRCRKWSVRGHVRHYKSGKTVYIKPFEKGVDRSNSKQISSPKTYIIDK